MEVVVLMPIGNELSKVGIEALVVSHNRQAYAPLKSYDDVYGLVS
jgi:hypothetical protein